MTISWKISNLTVQTTQETKQPEEVIALEEEEESEEDLEGLSLVERARKFWGRRKQSTPFEPEVNPITRMKGQKLIKDPTGATQQRQIVISSLNGPSFTFYEWQFTSNATVGDLKGELAKRSGYRTVKLYMDGELLHDSRKIVNLKLFEKGSAIKPGRLYYCPVMRDANQHKYQRTQVLYTR